MKYGITECWESPLIEERANGQRVLTGYAATFHRADDPGTEYELPGGVVERIAPTAFNRVVAEQQDVVAVVDHSTRAGDTLGRVSAGTLRLTVDARGLKYEADLPDTQTSRDIAALVQRGDIRGSSFKFVPVKAPLSRVNGRMVRTLEDVDVYDVGPVMHAAYASTTVGMRCAQLGDEEQIKAELSEEENQRLADAQKAADARKAYLDRKEKTEAA